VQRSCGCVRSSLGACPRKPILKMGSTARRSRTTVPGMRGDDQAPDSMFSYASPEQRVPKDHPLRAIRQLVDEILCGCRGISIIGRISAGS